jgi:3-oxoacyl-[acyl-carrier protein] reductase
LRQGGHGEITAVEDDHPIEAAPFTEVHLPPGRLAILVGVETVAAVIHAIDGAGRIVSMSSIIATTGYNGLSVYGATKAAATGFTRSLAREVGKLGITVNAIAPGFIATELTQGLSEEARARIAGRSALRRLPEAGDVARMVEYLLGEGGRNITGSILTIDAGNTA